MGSVERQLQRAAAELLRRTIGAVKRVQSTKALSHLFPVKVILLRYSHGTFRSNVCTVLQTPVRLCVRGRNTCVDEMEYKLSY